MAPPPPPTCLLLDERDTFLVPCDPVSSVFTDPLSPGADEICFTEY